MRSDPFSPDEVVVMRGIRDELLALDEAHGGWTTNVDARTTGFSLHVRFDKKPGVAVAARVATIFDQSTPLLCQIVSRVVDQIEAAVAADVAAS